MKITIFGLAGTGKSSTGKKVAERLGFSFLSSGNIFRQVAEENGMTLQELEKISNVDSKYDLELDQKIKEFGEKNDNFIVESRLAWHFIPDSFKIKLNCSDDVRIGRMAEREHKDFELVKDETLSRENLVTLRYKSYYGIDFKKIVEDDKNFDLIIDTEKNNLDQVVEIICTEVKKRT